MIKVPGTEAGLPAIEELTRLRININIWSFHLSGVK